MTTAELHGRWTDVRRRVPPTAAVEVLLVCGILAGTLVAAAAVSLMGLWALLPPIYLAAFIGIVIWPRHAAIALLVAAVAIEPQTVDVTQYVTYALYRMPPGFEDALPLTIAPVEIMLVLLTASVYLPGRAGLERRDRPALPLILFALPFAVLLGAAYGLVKGAPANLVYIEARGLIYGACIFLIALRLAPRNWETLARWAVAAAGLLAIIVLYRYFAHVRTGDMNVPIEFAFAHETPIFLVVGIVIAGALAVRNGRSLPERLALFGYCVVILAALVATQRRAATAVLIIGVAMAAVAYLPRRPLLVIGLSIPAVLGAGAYTAVYWDEQYGAVSQPARAIRSQINPDPRDQSSDQYRLTERFNVIQTLRVSPAFGVGFGRPFFEFNPLPNLSSYWPLQLYTPHQNVLWLWLKMGFVGITVFLSVVTIAVARCLRAMRGRRTDDPEFLAALVLSAIVLMVVVYGTIDLAFTGTRSMAPLAIAVALAFTLREAVPRSTTPPPEGSDDVAPAAVDPPGGRR